MHLSTAKIFITIYIHSRVDWKYIGSTKLPTFLNWLACLWLAWRCRPSWSSGRAGRTSPHWREWTCQTPCTQSGHLQK